MRQDDPVQHEARARSVAEVNGTLPSSALGGPVSFNLAGLSTVSAILITLMFLSGRYDVVQSVGR
jgi:hypothetical protein